MKVLVIGGSVFLGRAVVDEAFSAGADVTAFNRGRSGVLTDGVEHVVGDRTVLGDLRQLTDRFDVVVDTCGYVPADVAHSAALLAETCGHYVFVSTINVYPAWPSSRDYADRGVHDGRPDATADGVPDGLSDSESYGWLKTGCERAVQRAFGEDRTTIVRAGAIVGPNDSEIARLPWWIDRVGRGGEVLVPGAPTDLIALVDARDIARFAITGPAGTFTVPGPQARDTRSDLMTSCRAATGSDATFTYVTDEDWLVANDVAYWTELPLWIPRNVGPGTWVADHRAAEEAGMRWRPLADTVHDTWSWQRGVTGGWHPSPETPGLRAEREIELLAAWHAR